MPNIKSAEKRLRKNKPLRLHNRSIKSEIHTLGKKVLDAISKKDKNLALELYKAYSSALDKAGRKSIIHQNRANTKKSIIMAKINALS